MRKTIFWSSLVLGISFATGCATDEFGGTNNAALEQESSTSPGSDQALSAPHCVANLATQKLSCFETFTKAIAFATNDRIPDAPSDAKLAATDENFKARVNALAAIARRRGGVVPADTSVVIGIEYRDDNFQGPTLTEFNPFGFGCDGNFGTEDFESPSMPSGWNDQISSFIAFSNCAEILYEHDNFGGAQTQLATSLSSVGAAMNDRTSSIRWF